MKCWDIVRNTRGYRAYVEAGVNEEITQFYNRGNTASVLGEKECSNWVRESQLREVEDKVLVAQVLPRTLSIAQII